MARIPIEMPESAASNCTQHLFWIKSVGQHVEKGTALASVEAEKGLNFISAPSSGALEERTVAHGSVVQAGDVLGWFAED